MATIEREGVLVSLTETAAAKIKELQIQEPEGEADVLRIAVQGGGCSGFEYALGFDRGLQEGDVELELHGVTVVIDPFSAPYLSGAEIDFLNTILTNELTAINQYFIHAEMFHNWGLERLHQKLRHLSIDEMKDAQQIIQHILYLEGLPNLQRIGTVRVGESPREHLELDLQQEVDAIGTLTQAISHCAQVGDYTTRNILELITRDEETHVDWLETQLEAIRLVGIENYLAQKVDE